MTANQLKGYIKRLKTEMNALHKDTDPKLWNKYNDKLKEAETRMKDLEGGIKKTGGVMDLLQTKGGKLSLILGSIGKAAGLVYSGMERISQETQAWGDGWQVTVAKVKAGWNQLIANIGQGNDVMKASIRDAMEAAGKAQELIDDLFERNNSSYSGSPGKKKCPVHENIRNRGRDTEMSGRRFRLVTGNVTSP